MRLSALLAEAGLETEVVALYRGEPVPQTLSGDVPLVVMGGSMGVSDIGDPAHAYLADEVALLRRQLAADAPVLGICLGAQLMAHAAGARVFPNVGSGGERVYEVGWGPVDFVTGGGEPALAGLAARETMLHWHGDTFELPTGAVHLASTPACPNQAFRLGRRGFAVQFHPELDTETIALWLDSDADYVARANGAEGAARIRSETPRQFPAYETARDRLLRNIIRCLLAR
jgi:GMP synthase (glutamine-hydrolysing)